jgi:protein-tyrosine phosphatase
MRVSVCFVCLGNICRSPTAEGVFRKLVEVSGLSGEIEIDSAGTGAWHVGERADRRSRAAAEARGYQLTSVARQFQPRDLELFDYVLAMDEQNLAELQRMRRESGRSIHQPPKIQLLRDFDPTAPRGSSVPDPYYGGDAGFEEVLDVCERAAEGLLHHLKARDLVD